MPKMIRDIEQGSDAWFKLRCGSIGGSSIKAVLTGGKGKTRKSLMYQLAGERITGQKHEFKATPAMEEGTRREEESRDTFEFITGLKVEEVGLIQGDVQHTHCSPDGIINDMVGLELKNPLVHTQIKYIDENRLPLEYIAQVQYSMWVTGYDDWYFFSYYPGLKSFLKYVERDEEYIKNMEKEVKRFLKELDFLVKKMQ